MKPSRGRLFSLTWLEVAFVTLLLLRCDFDVGVPSRNQIRHACASAIACAVVAKIFPFAVQMFHVQLGMLLH